MKYGLMLSGGLDSACLAKELLEKSIEFTPYCYDTNNNNIFFAEMISDYLNLPKLNIVTLEETHHTKLLTEAICKILKDGKVSKIYTAMTKNPPDNFGGLPPDRGNDEYKNYVINPYFNLTKDQVLKNHLEDKFLIKYSHTCTESKKYRCGVCWQCKERSWAFEQLGIKDIGLF